MVHHILLHIGSENWAELICPTLMSPPAPLASKISPQESLMEDLQWLEKGNSAHQVIIMFSYSFD